MIDMAAIIEALRAAGGGSIKICVGEKPYEEDDDAESESEGSKEGEEEDDDEDEPEGGIERRTGYNRAAPRSKPPIVVVDDGPRADLERLMG